MVNVQNIPTLLPSSGPFAPCNTQNRIPAKKSGRPPKSTIIQDPIARRAIKRSLRHNRATEERDINERVGVLDEPPSDDWSAEDETRVNRILQEDGGFRLAKTKFKHCPALAETLRKIQRVEDFDRTSVHSIHKIARSEVEAKGETPSQLSALLYELGETIGTNGVKTNYPEDTWTRLGEDPLPLTIEDLRNIQATIDGMQWPEEEIYEDFACTTTQALKSYMAAKTDKIVIPQHTVLLDFMERSYKKILRHCLIREGEESLSGDEVSPAQVDDSSNLGREPSQARSLRLSPPIDTE
ncbi:hypothetical protein ACHAP8_010489 [Fusarium lateritium]